METAAARFRFSGGDGRLQHFCGAELGIGMAGGAAGERGVLDGVGEGLQEQFGAGTGRTDVVELFCVLSASMRDEVRVS